MRKSTYNRIYILCALLLLAVIFLAIPLSALAKNPLLNLTSDPSEVISVSNFLGSFGHWLGNLILTIGATFMGLAGIILDLSINWLVLDMGKILAGEGSSLGPVVDNVWSIIRDFANVVFIFGFIYIGIRTILQPDNSFTKSFLAKLVIAALLINFSLFFTKVVIDVANTTAVEVNDLMIRGESDRGIGFAFARYSGIGGWYQAVPGKDLNVAVEGGSIAFYVMGFFFLMIAGFVFAVGAVMFIIRFVALLFLMMFSPLMFALMVFPKTAGYAGQLWSALLRYAFFAPIFLFLVYVAFQVLSVYTFANDGDSLSTTLANPASKDTEYSVFLQFVVAIIFLIIALVIAQKMSIVGGGQAVKVANWTRGRVQGFVGRNVVGRLAENRLKHFERSMAADTKGAQRIKKLGLDRNIRNLYKVGTGAKFGDSQSLDDVRKDEKAIRVRYGKLKGELDLDTALAMPANSEAEKDARKAAIGKAVQNLSKSQIEEMGTDRREDLLANKDVAEHLSGSQVDDIMKSSEFDETQKGAIQKARQDALVKMYNTERENLAKTSVAHLEGLGTAYLTEARNAIRLTSTQMDDLEKKLSEGEYKQIAAAREGALTDLAKNLTVADYGVDKDGNRVDFRLKQNYILSQGSNEIAKMPAGALKELAPELSTDTLAKIVENGKLKKADQEEIRIKIKSTPEDSTHPHLNKTKEWLENSPLGQRFGQ